MHTSIQTKIDNLITQANINLSANNKNEIIALIHYTEALDLFDFISKSYPIQQHEIMVKISICYESLGNSKQALEYLNRSLAIVPNLPSLILYKSILLLSLHLTDESQRNLLKFKQLGRGNIQSHMFYYDTFRLVFYYVLKYEEDIILREINEYIEKYNPLTMTMNDSSNSSFVVIHYIKAQLCINSTSKKRQEEKEDISIKKYNENIFKANIFNSENTKYLIQEGVTQDNLFKIFTMIIPHVIDYHPKILCQYHTVFKGLNVFFVLFKAIKLFKIKVKRKKTKIYYIQQLKICHKTQSKERNSLNEITDGDFTERNKTVEEIKLEFHNEVRNLYKSVWVYNYAFSMKQLDKIGEIENNIKINYFIRNGYYASGNIKENILKGIEHNEDYKAKLLKHKEEMIVMQKCRKNDKHNSLTNINSNSTMMINNNNTNTKTEPSAQSQISTISNAKSNSCDGNTTNKKRQSNDTKMNKDFKRLKEKIPIHFNIQTELKTHSNNTNSQSINLIDLSDNENAIDKDKEKNKDREISVKETTNNDNYNSNNNNINKFHRKISIGSKGENGEELILSNCKKITNPSSIKIDNKKNNNQGSIKQTALLALRKNIPQSNKTDLYHMLSKKNTNINIEQKYNDFKQNTSKERLIKLRSNPSAQRYQISLSKDNEQSNNSNSTNQIHQNNIIKDKEITFTSIKSTNTKKKLEGKLLKQHSPGITHHHHKVLPSNSPHNNSYIPNSNNHNTNQLKHLNKSKCIVASIRTKNSNSAIRKPNVIQMRFNSFHSLKKEDSSLGSGILTYLENNSNANLNVNYNTNMKSIKESAKSSTNSNNNKSNK